MKKFTLFLAALLASVSTLFAAEEVYKTALFGGSYNSKTTDDYISTWTSTNDGFTVSLANFSNHDNQWDHIRCGRKSAASVATITTAAAIDKAITKVVVTLDKVTAANLNSTTLTVASDAAFTQDVQTITVTAAQGELPYTVTTPAENRYYKLTYDCKKGSNGFVQISKVEYYVALPAAAVATPTITPTTVDADGFYSGELAVKLACETEGATIYYTTDGTEPTSSSNEYTTALTFSNEFVHLTVKAIKGSNESYMDSAKYYHTSTIDLPYTTTQALQLYADKNEEVDSIYVAGKVTESIPSDTTANYTITDGTNPLYVYKGTADATSGLADITTMVEGDKVVLLGTIQEYRSNPQIASGSTIVKWTENADPVLTVTPTVIDFGSISMYAEAPQKTITVTAKNLTEEITVALSEKAAFLIDNTTLPTTGGKIVVTPDMEEIGENTATLTITSGEKKVTISLSDNILLANLISWSVNGVVTSAEDIIDGDAVVLPDDPAVPSACSAKSFIGWATTETVSAEGSDIEYITSATVPTKDATYYAVFALVEEGTTTTTAEIDFSKQGYTNAQDLDGEKIAINEHVTATFAKANAGTAPAYYDSGSAIRLYGGGTLTVSSLTNITEIKVTFGEKKNDIKSDIETWNNTTNTWVGTAKEVVLTVDAASGNDQFQKVAVTYHEPTITDYATTCSETPTQIESTPASSAKTATKRLENGVFIIEKNGIRYNAQGAVVE